MTQDFAVLRNLTDALMLSTGERASGQHLLEWVVGNEVLFWPAVKEHFFNLAFDPAVQFPEEIGRLHPSVAADPGRIYPGIEDRLMDFFTLVQKTPHGGGAEELQKVADFRLLPPRMLAPLTTYSTSMIPAHHADLIAHVMSQHMVDLGVQAVGSDTLVDRFSLGEVLQAVLSTPGLEVNISYGLVQVASPWDSPEAIEREGYFPQMSIETQDADGDLMRFRAHFTEGAALSWTVSVFCSGREHGTLEKPTRRELEILASRGDGFTDLINDACPIVPHGPHLEEEDPNLEHRIY